MERIQTHHHLLTEIIAEIFLRLPVKTLMRLRCVSKSWYNIIHDPIFITMYTAAANIRKTNTNSNCYYILHNVQITRDRYYDFRFLDWGKPFTENMIQGPPLNAPSFLLHNFRLYLEKIEGSCNGLLCFSIQDRRYQQVRLFLWNPSISKVKELATCNFSAVAYYYYHYCTVGFDFFPLVNDYKVVKISYSNSFSIKENDPPPNVQVYTLSTNSWKTIRVSVPCIACSSSGKTSLNGAFHWLADKNGGVGRLQVVFAFDFEGEVFKEILLPKFRTCGIKLKLFLGKFRESLSVIDYTTQFCTSTSFDIWVMKEYGVVESWTKLYTVREQIVTPFWFGNTGVFLFRGGRHIVSFDCENQHLKYLKHCSLSAAVIYDKSLVLLNEDDGGERPSKRGKFGSKKSKQVTKKKWIVASRQGEAVMGGNLVGAS